MFDLFVYGSPHVSFDMTMNPQGGANQGSVDLFANFDNKDPVADEPVTGVT